MFISSPPPPPPNPIPVTIWVHGTRPSSFLPKLSYDTKKKLDNITNVPAGLHAVTHIDQSLSHYQITKTLAESDPKQFPIEHFYVFGWSGELDRTARQGAAFDLKYELLTLNKEYKKKYNAPPTITLISHSHGGNVILEMIPYLKESDELAIDKFIPMACPVQKATSGNINHPMFKKVYALHSHCDMIQIMDIQRLHPLRKAFKELFKEKSINGFKKAYLQMIQKPLLSERHFPCSEHIIHANIAWGTTVPWNQEDIALYNLGEFIQKLHTQLRKHHKGLLHTEFVIPSFIRNLPDTLSQLDKQQMPTSTNPDITISI